MDDREAPGMLVSHLADSLGVHASVGTAFGAAVQRGNVTVIPVASTAWGFGGGGGTGAVSAAKPEAADGKTRRHEGSGGGGGARVRPIGYIVIRDDDAEFRPISSWALPMLAMVGLGMLGGMIVSRLARR